MDMYNGGRGERRSCPAEEAPKLRPLRPLAEHVLIRGKGEECPKEKKLHIPSSDEAFQVLLVTQN